MAFRHHELSALLAEHPAQAHRRLVQLFRLHAGNSRAVARSVGVDRATVFRWIDRLCGVGYKDPRGGKRGLPGRRVAPASLAKDLKTSSKRNGKKRTHDRN